MTDDEEKQLKQALLAADLSLRRKQEFWETPRNIAILVGVSATIAAAIGFWLGRESAAPPASNISPATIGSDGLMRLNQFVDAVQTAGIIVIAAMLVYVVVRLERTLTTASDKLKEALTTQRALQEGIERVWSRVETIEALVLERNAILPTAALRSTLEEVNRRLDQLEKGASGHS